MTKTNDPQQVCSEFATYDVEDSELLGDQYCSLAYAGPVAKAHTELMGVVQKLVDAPGGKDPRTDVIIDRLDKLERSIEALHKAHAADGPTLNALAERLEVIETQKVGAAEATTTVSGNAAQDVVAILNAIKGVS